MALRVGLVGAGLLGGALAERFCAAGFAVTAFDVDASRLTALAPLGVAPAASARDASAAADFVVLSLPDSHVASAVIGDLALTNTTVLVDTTTGEPAEMEAMGRRVTRYVDATIAGSSQQVRQGEAVVMAGGAADDVAACSALFATFAPRVFHVGPCGAAARMKLVVNLVLGLNRAALAEGLALAAAQGIDLALALDVLKSGPAFSTAMERKGPKMLHRDWTAEARLRQHHKDVRLMLAEGARLQRSLPLTEVHERLLAAAEAAGYGDADNAAVLEAYLPNERKA